ncbi:ThiF family adenylyltransferase [Bacillus sp. FJAT-42315]|uniref:ThiF family adenylyltransferase n=1 Tax=Bacillus sp. FJAT-42315 TaxID=2014077 RepID=UPI000C236F7C|nr:ThiF family adenylyltransferase [Bacillus sp. FJAT-42315]
MNDRYSRQELFLREKGSFTNKHVLLVGVGALGSALAEMLARAGVGHITLIDRDYVDWTNLQRQQLFTEQHAKDRLPKAVAAKQRLEEINSDIQITAITVDAGPEELEEVINKQSPNLLLDGTDNFETRFIINDLSQKYHIPWIYGACVGSQGISFPIIPGVGPCLHCLLDVLPTEGMTCDTTGVIAPAVQVTAAYQGAEALKILSGKLSDVRRELVAFDLWKNTFSSIRVASLRKKDCPSCGSQPHYPFLQKENQTRVAVLCGRETVQIRPPQGRSYQLDELASLLQKQNIDVKSNGFLLSAKLFDYRIVLFQDGRMLIHGTKDIAVAKKLYHQLFS